MALHGTNNQLMRYNNISEFLLQWEIQIKRNDLIWKYFGIGVTFQLYRNIFSALGSLITICAYLIIRGMSTTG